METRSLVLVTNRKTDLFVPTPYPRLAESRAAGAGVGGRVLKKTRVLGALELENCYRCWRQEFEELW